MKKTVAFALAVILCIGVFLGGCAPRVDKTPDQYKDIRWISYDYSFCIKPAESCTGYYKYNDKKYNIIVTFENSRLTAADRDNGNAELFSAEWMYEKDSNGAELLYIYDITFNKKDYPELENNFAEYVNLKQEKLQQSASE